MAGGVAGCLWIFVEVADFLLVYGDGQHFLLLKLVWMVFVALDHHQSLVLVQADLGGHQEDLGEEVLVLQDFLVVRLLQLGTPVHLRK